MVVSKDSGNTKTSAAYREENKEFSAMVQSMSKDIAELRRIMTFYAHPENYKKSYFKKSNVEKDGGAIARMMLGGDEYD